MAKGLVGGVNTTVKSVSTSSNTSLESLQGSVGTQTDVVVASLTDTTFAYSAKIDNTVPVSLEYVGKESDSLCIYVDNDARTISGDVKWRSMIANLPSEEDAYHAYPANKARLNFDALTEELKDVQTDIVALQSSCNQSSIDVKKYVEDITKLQTELAVCQEACVALRNSLESEVTARELADVKLRQKDSENLDTFKTDMSALTTQTVARLDTQDSRIQSNKDAIDSEEFRSKYAEEQLNSSIQATTKLLLSTRDEVGALDSEARELSTRISGIENSVALVNSAEHTEQIRELNSKVVSVEHALGDSVKATTKELVRLSDISYKHESEITNVTARVKQAEVLSADLRNDHSELSRAMEGVVRLQQSEIQDRDSQYTHLSTRISDEASVRRATDEFHEEELNRLEVRISLLQSELIQVLQNLANELRTRDEELANDMQSLTFEFIDAGNAPV